MKFDPPLLKATLLRRYKRFLADVRLVDGQQITVHCPNTGSMKNCVAANSVCYLYDANNSKRKYRYSWELATTPAGHLAGINTGRANQLVEEGIATGRIAELAGYDRLLREQKYGAENSRIDFLLESGERQCFVEVKSVTLAYADGDGRFPDAKSERASKHLRELMAVRESGQRAVLLFCVQHSGIESVAPADDIDPRYGHLLRTAVAAGVEVLAYRATPSVEGMQLDTPLPVLLSGAE